MKAPLPNNEIQRFETLLEYKILDTPSEAAFDDLTRLASYICQTPIALISLIDTNRQWFKSRVGLDTLETHRDLAFCSHAILQPDVFVVPDATDDERFATNLLVTSDPNIRFYAGVPLTNPEGYALGTLCVIDYIPRELTPDQIEALRTLGRQVIKQLELRRNLASLVLVSKKSKQAQKVSKQFFKKIVAGFGLASVILVLIGVISYQNTTVSSNNRSVIKNAYKKLNSLEKLLSQIKDAETRQRSYIITGKQTYIKPYQASLANVNQEIAKLKNLTIDQPNQQKQIATLEFLIAAKLAELNQTIDLRQKKGSEAALQVLLTNKSQNLMDDIRKAIDEIENEERAQRQQLSQTAQTWTRKTTVTIAIAICLSFIVLAVVYYFIYREVTERKRTEETLNQAGMDDYLSKPVFKEKLAATLEHWTGVILSKQELVVDEQTVSTTNNDTNDLAIDWEHLHRISENDGEFELNLLQIYLEDVRPRLEIMIAAIASDDFGQIAREAHHLKGASANVGATAMYLVADKLEKLAYEQELRDATNLVLESKEFINSMQDFLTRKNSV
ncbi:putative GAF and Chase3 sensor phosphotransfer protein [Nostoc punctiforme PCC 73102]|uniref:Putative GAF and Chase3 sensor phosphotransfer protein n=2 Tax=Nostoc punctiforme TaxID=272131 RepID=B2IZV9_NOSP7|nr:putative GAF and Chase3 sensor phosphotransfer protein [Nostoc punctiforme PCC 73102]